MAGILASNANLDDQGFAAVVRDLERHQLVLDNLGVSTGDNASNASSELSTEASAATTQPVAVISMGGSTVTFPTTSGTIPTLSILYDKIGIAIGSSSFDLPSGTYQFSAAAYGEIGTITSRVYYLNIILFNGATPISSINGKLIASADGVNMPLAMPIARLATNASGSTYSLTFSCSGMGASDQCAILGFHFFITKIG